MGPKGLYRWLLSHDCIEQYSFFDCGIFNYDSGRACALCRHGEAEHNSSSEWTLRDPSLTLNGRRQARSARATLMAQGLLGAAPLEAECEGSSSAQAQLVVSSPLRRTLQTAEILCAGTLLPLVAHPDLQETSQVPC
jgi:broad specificity phosphatase PhoE